MAVPRLILDCSQSNTQVTRDSPTGQSIDLQVLPPPLDKMELNVMFTSSHSTWSVAKSVLALLLELLLPAQ